VLEAPPAAPRPWQLVAGREISVKLRDKNFIMATVFTLVILVIVFGIQAFLENRPDEARIAVPSQSAAAIADRAEQAGVAGGAKLDWTTTTVADETAALDLVRAGEADVALVPDGDGWRLVGDRSKDDTVATWVGQVVKDEALTRNAAQHGTTLEQLSAGSVVGYDLLDKDARDPGFAKVVGFEADHLGEAGVPRILVEQVVADDGARGELLQGGAVLRRVARKGLVLDHLTDPRRDGVVLAAVADEAPPVAVRHERHVGLAGPDEVERRGLVGHGGGRPVELRAAGDTGLFRAVRDGGGGLRGHGDPRLVGPVLEERLDPEDDDQDHEREDRGHDEVLVPQLDRDLATRDELPRARGRRGRLEHRGVSSLRSGVRAGHAVTSR
jgi:hypothetical protein